MESIVEILAKAPRLHLGQGIPVGGADETHIHRLQLAAANPLQGPGLDEAQQLALQVEIHLADLIQKQGTPIGQAGGPLAIPLGPGKRSLHVAEDLALHQVMGNGGAVEGDEGTLAAGAALVNGLGAYLLAGTALSCDEHGRLARSRALNDAIDRLHRQGGADETGEGAALEILPVLGHQEAELPMVDGIAHRGAQALAIEGLGQKIERPQPHRLHRHVHRTVRRDHHHGARQLLLGDLLQDVHPGHVRQLQIEQYHGRGLGQHQLDGPLPAIGGHDLIPLLTQVLFVDHGQAAGVFHQQYARFVFRHGDSSLRLICLFILLGYRHGLKPAIASFLYSGWQALVKTAPEGAVSHLTSRLTAWQRRPPWRHPLRRQALRWRAARHRIPARRWPGWSRHHARHRPAWRAGRT